MNQSSMFIEILNNRFRDSVPSISEIAAEFKELSESDLLFVLQEDQRLRTQRGLPHSAEEYMSLFGHRLNESSHLDLIYHEFVLREESTQSPEFAEYLRRFPQYLEPLQRQFALHDALRPPLSVITAGSTLPPGATATIPGSTAVGQSRPELSRFRIKGVLGRGAMGIVYDATEISLNRRVALKMLQTANVDHPESFQRLHREAAAVAKLRHPNIVTLYQIDDSSENPVLVMELVDGSTLQQILRNGPIPVEAALLYMDGICDAVAYANSESVIHRDLKPANILIRSKTGQPVVTDFGLARQISDQPTHSGNVVGTPQYMAPEQARGESASARSEVYSLGAVLYEMISGRPPFLAANSWDIFHQILHHDAPRLKVLNPAVPLELQTICEKCLEKEASRRYASAAELRDDLIRFRDGKPLKATPTPPWTRLWKWCRRNRVTSALLAVIITLFSTLSIGSIVAAARLAEKNTQLAKQTRIAQDSQRAALEDRQTVIDSYNSLVRDLYDDLSRTSGTVRQRNAIIKTSLEGLERMAMRSADQQVDASRVVALLRMGDLESLLGNDVKSQQYFQEANELSLQLIEASPNDLTPVTLLATGLKSSGNLYYRGGRMTEAKAALESALKEIQAVIAADQENNDAIVLAIEISNQLTDIVWVARGNHLELASNSVQLAEQCLASNPEARNVVSVCGMAYQRKARALVETGQPTLGVEFYQKADELFQRNTDRDPDDADAFSVLLVNRRLLANALAFSGKPEEALRVLAKVLEGTTFLSNADPDSVPRANQVVLAYLSQALIHESTGNQQASRQALLDAAQNARECMALNPATAQLSQIYCQINLQLAILELELTQNWEQAEYHLDEFSKTARGDEQRPPVPDSGLAPYLPTLNCFEEPIRRHCGSWKKEFTSDGTAFLIALYAFLGFDPDSGRLSTETLSRIQSAIGDERTTPESLSDVFQLAHSLAASPLNKSMIFLSQAVTYARIAEAAEKRDDPEVRSIWLDRAVECLVEFQRTLPLEYQQSVPGDGRLRWMQSTPEFQKSPAVQDSSP